MGGLFIQKCTTIDSAVSNCAIVRQCISNSPTIIQCFFHVASCRTVLFSAIIWFSYLFPTIQIVNSVFWNVQPLYSKVSNWPMIGQKVMIMTQNNKLNHSMCANIGTDTINKINKNNKNTSFVIGHVPFVRYHLSHVMCCKSPVTCHMSLTQRATSTDPPPANSMLTFF